MSIHSGAARREGTRRGLLFLRARAIGVILVLASASLWFRISVNAPAQNENSDPYRFAREEMVATLESSLYRISDKRVLRAMRETPRQEFVPAAQRSNAYEDRPLPIGWEQTISQPYIVAFMTEQLHPEPHERVLEIGTGSGYQAAILAPLVKEVYTIEIVEGLAERAKETLDRLGYGNVHVRHGDGYLGWPEQAPFDAIIVTCAPEKVPRPLVEQLKEGGRMMIPVGTAGGKQELVLLERSGGEVKRKSVLPVRFVPMTGRAQRGGE